MPYKSIQINDPQSVYQKNFKITQFYKGFSSVNANTEGTKLFDLDLVKQNIINHFRTKKGERLMNPSFGSIIWNLLMDPLTPETTELLKKDINTICNYDPRATPIQIDLTEYPNGYLLEITLQMNGTNQTANLKLAFDQQLGLITQ
jgi:phage baseplate assembly protein W